MKRNQFFYIVIFCFGFLVIGLCSENRFSILSQIKALLIIENDFKDVQKVSNKIDVDCLKLFVSTENKQNIITQQKKAINEDKYFSYVEAICLIDNDSIPVKIKLKGDRSIHFNDTSKLSFRIKVLNNKSIYNLKKFSLHHPIARNYIFEWIFHKALGSIDLINLEYKFLNVELNGEKLGLYAFEEHFEKSLIENKKLPVGPILRFNEDYSGYDLHTTFVEPFQSKFWFSNYPDITNDAISKMEKWRRSKLTTSEVFDVESLARYFAITDVLWLHHGQAWKSIRFYYNSETELFYPIGYDGHYNEFFIKNKIAPQLSSTLPIMQVDKKFWVEHYNEWYRLLFNNPDSFDESFFEMYIKYLKEYSSMKWIDQFLNSIKKGLSENLNIIYSQKDSFEDKIFHYGSNKFSFSEQSIYDRAEQVNKILNKEQNIHAYPIINEKGYLEVEIENVGFIPIKIDSIQIQKNNSIETLYFNKIILPHQSNTNPVFERILVDNAVISENENVSIYFHSIGENTPLVVKMFTWKRS
jgi:hypothetical protein